MLNVRIQTPEVQKLSPKITVVGVGGAGGNAVNNMISSGLEGCEFLVCNTDAQALEGSLCDQQIQLGAGVTGGLGAGARPEVGQKSAEESLVEVMKYLEGSNMAFITAGMGGGTGTGAAPVIAKACRDSGILTVGVVTKPFHFEGTHRMKQAEAGIEEMQDYVDTLIVIPNQNLFRIANEKTTFAEAFKMADGVLQSGVRGVTDLMVMPGLINLDFADIRSAMLEMGKAMMGNGEADGERRSIEAAEAAINNPLLDDVSMKGARGVIINVTGGQDMTLYEVDEACNRIRDEVDPNANIIFGSTFDESMDGKMRVSVVATGIDGAQAVRTLPRSGGVRVTGVNKTETEKKESDKPRVEATPQRPMVQTEVARAMTMNARQEAVVKEKTEPESGMFEQEEFQGSASKSSSMRGSVYQGKFIPPTPVMPDPQDTGHFTSSGQSYAAPAAPQPEPQESRIVPETLQASRPVDVIPAPTQNLVLRPPVPGAATAERRKNPSFFERITNAYKGTHGGEDMHEEHSDAQGSAGGSTTSGGGFHGLRAAPRSQYTTPQEPSQGQLNIDTPAAPKKGDDNDLDIPAFLRRQAN